MNKLFGTFIIASFALLSCNSRESANTNSVDTLQNKVADTLVSQPVIQPQKEIVVNAREAIARLNAVMKKYEEPSQTFEVASNKQIQIKGKQGTVIYLNPSDLETENGKPLGKNIKVELKELTNQTDLVYNNAQTVSDGNLLVSGGAYYINMTSDGQKLRIKKDKTVKVAFSKMSKDEMSLFYGQRDSTGNMNWKQANEKFTTKKVTVEEIKKRRKIVGGWQSIMIENDSLVRQSGVNYDTSDLTEEEKKKFEEENAMYDKVYEAIDIKNFGWINCDKLINTPTAALAVNFNPKDSVLFANLLLIFQDRNSAMKNYFIEGDKNYYNGIFSRIPIGAKTRLIAYTVKDDKVFAYSSDITTKVGHIITPTLQAINEKDFKKLLTSN